MNRKDTMRPKKLLFLIPFILVKVFAVSFICLRLTYLSEGEEAEKRGVVDFSMIVPDDSDSFQPEINGDDYDPDIQQENNFQEMHALNNRRIWSTPHVKQTTRFIYHALHKTASETTRQSLRIFCAGKGIRCLSYRFCSDQAQYMYCSQKLGNNSKTKDSWWDFGSMTSYRIRVGCCPPAKYVKKFDGLTEHFPLTAPGALEFLRTRFHKDSFRFTILRHPFDQISSYHSMLYKNDYQFLNPPNFTTTIDIFDRITREKSYLSKVPLNIQKLYHIISNSQAKELGWRGTLESLDEILRYLDTLDFVGLFERLGKSWSLLAHKLNWSLELFQFETLRIWPKTKYGRTTELERQLTVIQYADLALYRRAQYLFKKTLKENGEYILDYQNTDPERLFSQL